MITQEQLKELLDYNPDTGLFTWKKSKGRSKSGNIAGTKRRDGYYAIAINKKTYLAHRLAWIYVNGEFNKKFIDHIDLDKSNNKISNLREASSQDNNRNIKIKSHNKCGVKGVYFCKGHKKWCASARVNYKNKHIGYFDNIDDAGNAYQKYTKELYKEFYNEQHDS